MGPGATLIYILGFTGVFIGLTAVYGADFAESWVAGVWLWLFVAGSMLLSL